MSEHEFSAASDQAPVIALSGVRLTLPSAAGPVNILRGVDLTVLPGERLGLVGPSGSGKSTLMMVIAGIERPDSGRIVVAGRNFAEQDEDALANFRRECVGIVFQSFHLVPTMTALENVALPLEFARRTDAFARAAAALAHLGLSDRGHHYPAQLSGGEQQRVAIARAFVARPALVLADEPTGNLDRVTGGAVIDTLFALADENRATLVLITHDENLALRCSRVVAMADGRISDSGHAGARAGYGVR